MTTLSMGRALLLGAMMLTTDGGAMVAAAPRQQPGISRADLQRHDLSIDGRAMVQVRVDFAPGVIAARHRHPGEEIVYVLKGSLEYDVEGQKAAALHQGDVLFIPAGAAHKVTNIGTGDASELATYIVEKGKPLVVPAP